MRLAVFGPALLAASIAVAQPPAERAKEHVTAADTAMAEGRFEDAARSYTTSYAMSRDPSLFLKIATAYAKLGTCDVAVDYYGLVLTEGPPDEVARSNAREGIRACGGDPDRFAPKPPPPAPTPVGPTEGTHQTSAGGSVVKTTADASSATERPKTITPTTTRDRVAWLMVAGSVAFVTMGAVMAYATESAENDLLDLFVGFGGQPSQFDEATQARYDELVAEGERYERLSWIGFGLAAATAVTATVLFTTRKTDTRVQVLPSVGKDSAGVSAGFAF